MIKPLKDGTGSRDSIIKLGAIWILTCLIPGVYDQTATCQPQPETPHLVSLSTYVREPSDRAWNLRIVGKIPSYASLYIIIHDVNGQLIHHGEISGNFPPDKPLVITFKPDGKSGDYKIKLVGSTQSVLSRPLTDLPFEVGGGQEFIMGHSAIPVYFKPPPHIAQMALGSYMGNLKVFNPDNSLLADTSATGKYLKDGDTKDPLSRFFSHRFNIIEFPAQSGQVYRLDSSATFTLRSREMLYLAFDPAKLFEPSTELNKINWWELIP